MNELDVIYVAIAASGFSEETLQKIDDLTNDILYGRKDFIGFTLSEHAGLCKGGAPLIGASIVVSYARRSLTAGGNAEGSKGSSPANWQIDEEQERLLEEWARAKGQKCKLPDKDSNILKMYKYSEGNFDVNLVSPTIEYP